MCLVLPFRSNMSLLQLLQLPLVVMWASAHLLLLIATILLAHRLWSPVALKAMPCLASDKASTRTEDHRRGLERQVKMLALKSRYQRISGAGKVACRLRNRGREGGVQ